MEAMARSNEVMLDERCHFARWSVWIVASGVVIEVCETDLDRWLVCCRRCQVFLLAIFLQMRNEPSTVMQQ
jgi:hypothetical protein